MTDPKDEYSEIREDLEKKASVLRRRIEAIHKDRTRQDGPLSADWEEQATELENEEVLAELDVSQRETLKAIQAALKRLDAGSYGICVECDTKIDLRRLEARPFATRCISCARELEESGEQA